MSLLALRVVTFAAALVIVTYPGEIALRAARGQGPAGQSTRAEKTSKVPAELNELWVEPEPNRDLFYGVGGRALMPQPMTRFTVIGVKKGGFSDGYTLRDPRGSEWSAKLYPEARTEVVASRILWGLGYHQPPIYTMEQWWADGAKGDNPQPVARFREKAPAFHGLTEDEDWSYSDNPFVGSQPLDGLLVLQVMLTNADLKPAQNMRYTLTEKVEGARRWYVARDLGQSFGRTGLLSALRDDIDAYDRSKFILGVDEGLVQFEYYGPHVGLMKSITPADVRWMAGRLSRLTDQQWLDAFRAGGYADSTAQRFIRRMKMKIAEGLAIEG